MACSKGGGMYFWKCWRDTRSIFFIPLIIAAVIMPVAAVVCVGTGLLEEFGLSAVLSTFGLLGMVAALGLGVLGASEEFAEKTVQFLFTKPRTPAYFVWAGWSVGCIELLLIALVNLSVFWVTLSRFNWNPYHYTLFRSNTQHNILTSMMGSMSQFLSNYY